MSGRLYTESPWARQAFTRDERLAIEAALPDGVRVVVTCNASHSKYRLQAYRVFSPDPLSTFEAVGDPVAAARLMADVLAAEAVA